MRGGGLLKGWRPIEADDEGAGGDDEDAEEAGDEAGAEAGMPRRRSGRMTRSMGAALRR